MQKIEVRSYEMKPWKSFSSWNFVPYFFFNLYTDLLYFWHITPKRYRDYLCEISSSYFGWFGRYLTWGRDISRLVWSWPWMHTLFWFFLGWRIVKIFLWVKRLSNAFPYITYETHDNWDIWLLSNKRYIKY